MDERFESARAELTLANVDLTGVKLAGKATCTGGKHPNPSLHEYPLLAWMSGHHKFGKCVFLEDQKASVDDVAKALPMVPDLAALAAKFNTDEEHVRQAVAYAIKAGMLTAS